MPLEQKQLVRVAPPTQQPLERSSLTVTPAPAALSDAPLQTEVSVHRTFSAMVEEQRRLGEHSYDDATVLSNAFISQEIALLQRRVNDELARVLLHHSCNSFAAQHEGEVALQNARMQVDQQAARIAALEQMLARQADEAKRLNMELQEARAAAASKLGARGEFDPAVLNIDTHPKYRRLQEDFIAVFDENAKLKQLMREKYGDVDIEQQLALLRLVQAFASRQGGLQPVHDLRSCTEFLRALFAQLEPE